MLREIERILESGELSGFKGTPEGHLGGKHVRLLEDAFCEYFNIKYAVACNSATSALHMALIACGVGSSDEVVVSPYSFSSSASCTLMVGAIPEFVDIRDDTFNINFPPLRLRLRVSAIISVHLFGHPCDIPLTATKARLIEDCAQAIGAEIGRQKVGTFGDCGVFSFNQSKHISTGEGGMLITNSDFIARVARAVRNHGEVSDPELRIVGYNYRIGEIEACLALEQFKKLDEMIEYRTELALYLTEKLSEIDEITPPVTYPNCKHVYWMYAMKFKGNRDAFVDKMVEKGVKFGKGYTRPLYHLPIYGINEELCPVAERMYREVITVDWVRYPTTKEYINKVVEYMKEVLK